MMTIVLIVCFALLFTAATLALYRLLTGPTLLDRIIGFDMGTICVVGMNIILSIYWDTDLLVELMLIFSLLGFVTAVAFVSYLHRNPKRLWYGSGIEGRGKEAKP